MTSNDSFAYRSRRFQLACSIPASASATSRCPLATPARLSRVSACPSKKISIIQQTQLITRRRLTKRSWCNNQTSGLGRKRSASVMMRRSVIIDAYRPEGDIVLPSSINDVFNHRGQYPSDWRKKAEQDQLLHVGGYRPLPSRL